MWLSRLSVYRPVFTTMVVGVLMILGIIGFSRLPVDMFPDVSIPVITAIVPYPGASPAQVENEVVKPIEDAVAGLAGIDDMFSTSRESVGIVVVAFTMDTDIDQAVGEFRDRVMGQKAFLPEGVQDPIFRRIDPAATPAVTYAVSGDMDPISIRRLVDKTIRPALEQVEGVGAVEVKGGQEREVQVALDLPKLAELRIPLMQVIQLLGYDTLDIPGGHVNVGEARIGLRAAGQVEDAAELGSIVVQGFPAPIYLRDVARITDGTKEQETLARVDGNRAVTLELIKESGANTIAVVDDASEVVAGLNLPPGVVVAPVVDTSGMVRAMSHEMYISLVIGALMAVLVVYFFMVDWRSTFISATALPTSVITTFFFMWISGFSLNILSLLGMSLAIGILIDDAVVVREVIYRHLEAGKDPIKAALEGTSEVALAVLATTLSILAVFIPVGFVGGLVGQFFGQFGLTIAFAVSISLFIAFTVDPMLSARISRVVDHDSRGPVAKALVESHRAVDEAYGALLHWALRHGKTIIAVSTVMFLGSLAMVALSGFEFMPQLDKSSFDVKVDLPPSTSLEAAERKAEILEREIWKTDEVTHVYTVIGQDGAIDRVTLRVLTRGKEERTRLVSEIRSEVRDRLSTIPGMDVAVEAAPIIEGAQMSRPVEIEITGDDFAAMERVASQVRAGLTRVPGAVDIQSTLRSPSPELVLDVDRDKVATAGLSAGQAGIALRMAVAGQVVGTMRDGDEQVDIRVQAREEDKDPRTLMSSVLLLSPIPRVDDPWKRGMPVALQDVGRLLTSSAQSTIKRHDRQRFLKVSCALGDRPLSDVVDDAQAMLDGMDLPAGVRVRIVGEAELASDAMDSLLLALGLAVVFVYAVLASQFESFIHPFTIMLSLPLAVVGAFATVFLAGWPVGIPTMLGIILLMGLVTKNAILLVDRANQLVGEGKTAIDAMLEAGTVRLRPILMTSLAMILGMTPPALMESASSGINKPLAVPVIGGLMASTLLTLVVVPVVWLGVERFRTWLAEEET